MKTMTAAASLGLALGMMAATIGHAQIEIPTVTVADAGSPNDSTGYGGVSYDYNIAVTEVNLFQYTAFLNAVAATDTYNLFNTNMGTDPKIAGITRSGGSGNYEYAVSGSGARPVTYVSWFDAARFANWLANGQPTGPQGDGTTENGAYALFGATSGVSFTKNAINPNTGTTTTWWIPSENEWYKAAYYEPGVSGPSDDYWLYPTRSDSAPGNVIGAGTNQANYFDGDYSVTQSSTYDPSQSYLTDGGAFGNSASFYGTFDQGGNVMEWTDAVAGAYTRVRRGGAWGSTAYGMQASSRDTFDFGGAGPTYESYTVGFRVASVPEPSTVVLVLMGGGAYWFRKRRKVTR